MTKIFLIAVHEFRKSVFRRRFLVVLLIPLIVAVIGGVVGFVTIGAVSRFDGGKIGYLDPSNALDKAQNPPDAAFTFTQFDSEDSAKAALAKPAAGTGKAVSARHL